MPDENVSSCQSCGASIYPEHTEKGIAGYLGGQMLCPHCFADAKKSLAAPSSVASSAAVDEMHDEDALKPIAFDNAESPGSSDAAHATGIHGFSGDTLASVASNLHDESKFKRPLDPTERSATRCRTFHAKLNDSAVAFMNDQMNTWVDSHPDMKIKFATSTIGIFEGKHKDPNLILTVFY